MAIGAVGVLLFPGFTALIGQEGGVSLLGVPVTNINYNSQVFPAILCVLFLWGVERLFNRVTSGPIRVFFVPMMCFLIVVPVTMVALGPLGYGMGTLLTSAMLWLHATLGWVAVALLAALLPFVISIGMHKAFLPPTMNQVGATSSESLYLPASLAHNLSEAGATLAVALRTKRTGLRATSVSASVSAVFGITEPALYGVTLQNRRTMLAVITGSLTGGAYLGLMDVSAHAVVGPGLASMSMFVNDDAPMNIVHAAIGFGTSLVVSFLVSLFIWKDAPPAGRAHHRSRRGRSGFDARRGWAAHRPAERHRDPARRGRRPRVQLRDARRGHRDRPGGRPCQRPRGRGGDLAPPLPARRRHHHRRGRRGPRPRGTGHRQARR